MIVVLGWKEHQRILKSLLACFILVLAGCAGGSGGQRWEQIFAPDPQLINPPSNQEVPADANQTVKLPENFPGEIPIYPDSVLIRVTEASNSSVLPGTPPPSPVEVGVVTRWQTQDAVNQVKMFYTQQFQDNGWQLLPSSSETDTVIARRGSLVVTVTLSAEGRSPATDVGNQPSDRLPTKTEFLLQYDRLSESIANQNSSSSNQDASTTGKPTEDPTKGQFIGPLLSQSQPNANLPLGGNSSQTPTNKPQTFSDLEKVPTSLRSAIKDLSSLGVLPLNQSGEKATPSGLLEPGQSITRREYARWLVAANNRFFANRPAWQIRLGDVNAKSIFQDVPTNDPDFAAIQGLAEAGIIPSSLSNETVQTFRPDAPLTREQMLLWKVPLDIRRSLPPTNVEAVKQAWGFQDVARIDPKALQAVLADFQNGDLSNIRRVFGYTTLFQPQKAVTRAEAAATLWYFGSQTEGISAQDLLKIANPGN